VRRCERLQRVAVGAEAAAARVVLDQERHAAADDGCEQAEREIGAAPSERVDQLRRQRRHHQRADADAADRNSGREAAPPHEPALHGADSRHVGAADAETDPEAVRRVNLDQVACGARGGKSQSG
jgi:hypothetical protein